MQAIRAAEQHVEGVVGPILGMDSAVGVYREALSRLGHTLQASQIGNAVGGQKLFDMARSGGGQARQAYDTGAGTRRAAMFPHANRLR